jgi:hypothetical protein
MLRYLNISLIFLCFLVYSQAYPIITNALFSHTGIKILLELTTSSPQQTENNTEQAVLIMLCGYVDVTHQQHYHSETNLFHSPNAAIKYGTAPSNSSDSGKMFTLQKRPVRVMVGTNPELQAEVYLRTIKVLRNAYQYTYIFNNLC